MKKSRFPDDDILAILKQADSEVPWPSLFREQVMSGASFISGEPNLAACVDASMMSRLKEPENESRRLKKIYAKERIKAIKRHEAGVKVDEISRDLGISAGTFYNWRSK